MEGSFFAKRQSRSGVKGARFDVLELATCSALARFLEPPTMDEPCTSYEGGEAGSSDLEKKVGGRREEREG